MQVVDLTEDDDMLEVVEVHVRPPTSQNNNHAFIDLTREGSEPPIARSSPRRQDSDGQAGQPENEDGASREGRHLRWWLNGLDVAGLLHHPEDTHERSTVASDGSPRSRDSRSRTSTNISKHTTSTSSVVSNRTMSDISSVSLTWYVNKESSEAEEDARERAELAHWRLCLDSNDETMPSRPPSDLCSPVSSSSNNSDDASSVISSSIGADMTDSDEEYYTVTECRRDLQLQCPAPAAAPTAKRDHGQHRHSSRRTIEL
ncbi:unnamed protein product [Trichogramma brassicae]|uniref:Uncharacterized protein n=1 Tax=Trichogramma brassicae TaxID=86971 RepID=A0A6H5IWH0_9HYME|nr:unnamed protein product [Trichogramma brassicae]